MGIWTWLRAKKQEPTKIGLTPAALKVAVLLCNNSIPCNHHSEQAVEFFNIFTSDLPWSNPGDSEKVWAEIDAFCYAKALRDRASCMVHITRINQIIQGIAATAWHNGNQAGKRVSASVPGIDLDTPLKG